MAFEEVCLLKCLVVEEVSLSKVDAWHLERVILRLYKVIANSYDLCSLYLGKSVFLLEKWEEVNEEITTFFMQPQQHVFFQM